MRALTLFAIEHAPAEGDLLDMIEARPFKPTQPTETTSCGWVPPREVNGALAEVIDGHYILKLKIERRTVPAKTLDKYVEALASKIKETTGRKPGKKQRRELREQAWTDLAPTAFPREKTVDVWIDFERETVAIGTTSGGDADLALSLLCGSAASERQAMTLQNYNTAQSPRAAMAWWLLDEPDACLTIDDQIELRGDSKSVVRIKNRNVAGDAEVRRLITADGMRPAFMGMTWRDAVSFEMTDNMRLRRIETLTPSDMSGADSFDANWAIFIGAMRPALADLIAALGGQQTQEVTPITDHDYRRACEAVSTGVTAPDIEPLTAILGLTTSAAQQALSRMEAEGLISAPSTAGKREVIAECEA
jgi:recombination associated protein RdgC